MLTPLLCTLPFLTGAITMVALLKSDGEKRIRYALWFAISAASIPYLNYVSQPLIDDPRDLRIFTWTLVLSLPVFLAWVVLANMGEKYEKAARLVLLVALGPLYAYALLQVFHLLDTWSFAQDAELIIRIMFYGIFWVFGMWARDYEIILFPESRKAG